MSVTLKNLSLNSRLDKLEDELRVMLLLSPKKKYQMQGDKLYCDCIPEQKECCYLQDLKCVEISNKSRSKSCPTKECKTLPMKEDNKLMRDRTKTGLRAVKPNETELKVAKIRKKRSAKSCSCKVSSCSKSTDNDKENVPPDSKKSTRKARPSKKRIIKKSNLIIQKESPVVELTSKPESYFIPSNPVESKRPCECFNQENTLKIEVTALRHDVENLTKSNKETKALDEFEKLHSCKVEYEKELQRLKTENHKLEEDIRNEQNLRNTKVDEATSEAKLLVDKIRSEEERLVRELQEKNHLIKRLSKAAEDLSKTVQEKEMENTAISCKFQQIETNAKIATEKIAVLKGTNKQLAKTVLDKHNSLQSYRSKNSKIIKDVKESKAKIKISKEEIRKLKDAAQQCVCKNFNSIQTQINSGSQEKFVDLMSKITDLENVQVVNFAKIVEENKTLKRNYENLKEKMNDVEKKEKEKLPCKCKHLEKEMKDLLDKDKKNENDRKELKELINELTVLLKKQKLRLEEVNELNNKQVEMLRAQEAVIASHNEQVALIEMENKMIKQKYSDLEREIEKQKLELDSPLKKQIEHARTTIAEDKDALQIKEKIIEDQAATISELKKKIQINSGVAMAVMNQGITQQIELKKSKQESDELIRKLEFENNALKEDLQELHASKSTLESHIAHIETVLERDHTAQAQLAAQKQLVGTLQSQLGVQQREYQLQIDVLGRERAQARRAAKYATAQLVETLRDFQRQSESQSQVRDMLKGLLRERDSKLKTAIVKMSSLTFDPDSVASAISNQNQHSDVAPEGDETDEETDHQLHTDFQQQLRHLVPADLYTDTSMNRKGRIASRSVENRSKVVEFDQIDGDKHGKGEEFHDEKLLKELYFSANKGVAKGEKQERVKRKCTKNFVITPNSDDESQYIYIPKYKTTTNDPSDSPKASPKNEISNLGSNLKIIKCSKNCIELGRKKKSTSVSKCPCGTN